MRLAGTITVAGVLCVAALAAATQTIAGASAYQRALGEPLVRLDDGAAIYWPWSIIAWSSRWSDAHPRQFGLAHLVLVCGLAGAIISAGVVMQGAPPRLRRHGANGWSSFRDAREIGLFAAKGVVLGRLDGEILASTRRHGRAIWCFASARTAPTLSSIPSSDQSSGQSRAE
jgi:type IV secretion system protein VirD4